MAKEEADPKLRALWLSAAARGYELGAKPPTDEADRLEPARKPLNEGA